MNVAHNLARLIASGEVTRVNRTATSQPEHLHSVGRHASHNDQSAAALEHAFFNTFLSALSRQEFGGPEAPPPKHIDQWGSALLGAEPLSSKAVPQMSVVQHVVVLIRVLAPECADYGQAFLPREGELSFPWIGGDPWIPRRFTPDCPRILRPRILTAASLGLSEAGGTSQIRRYQTNAQPDAFLRTPCELESLYEAVCQHGVADVDADNDDGDDNDHEPD